MLVGLVTWWLCQAEHRLEPFGHDRFHGRSSCLKAARKNPELRSL